MTFEYEQTILARLSKPVQNWFFLLYTYPIFYISGSGGSCGASGNSLYCGQALNSVHDVLVAYQTPICDCSTPFAVNIVTDDGTDAQSAASINRGKVL